MFNFMSVTLQGFRHGLNSFCLLTSIYIYVLYTYMPNKTIYVSEKDASLFDEAKDIAGEALSSVIVRALREYVSRHQEKAKGMKDVVVKVGSHIAEREQRFVGQKIGDWKGFDDAKEWYMSATIYQTQKGNIAVHLVTICKASLLTNSKEWKKTGDYLVDARSAELIVGQNSEDFVGKMPSSLLDIVKEVATREEKPVEYLDI